MDCVCVCARVYVYVCVHVYPLPRLSITSGVMIWTLYDSLNKFYNFYMVAAVDIVSIELKHIVETNLFYLKIIPVSKST